jgi:amino acid adenylation domain-containing protein/thioester reductase-like protein
VSANEAHFIPRFRAMAAGCASRVALEDGGARLTYGELEARASLIAAELRTLGAGAEDVVALRTGDRVGIVCGMLGAWMVNAAFVVAPPDLPEDRARRMERDARATFALDARAPAAVACDDPPSANPHRASALLAYVVFTSGTTGAPRGVLVTHEGLVPMLDAQIAAFELGPGARCLWMSSPLFDASISDVGTALLSGATLVCTSSHTRLSPRALVARMAELRITHVDLPPSLLALLDVASLPTSLRTIIIGGEACADGVVERAAKQVRLVNVYGPTEATVCTSLCVCEPGDRHHGRLGLPLPHVKYVVEDGELLIGGSCLARGYAGDDALTQRRFVERGGERFYRSGDRVRSRAGSHELEYVGRVDRQVKIAGVRIEPEEIEARLRDDPDVVDVAVVPVGRSLVAFVVSRHGHCDVIRERLAQRVPAWLVPSRFIALSELPRLSSSKVDHAALAATVAGDGASREIAVDETLRALCDAMTLAIGRPVAVDDDFIALGADSLALLEASAEADARGIVVSPETIATERTPTRIAASREIIGASVASLEADVSRVAQRPIETTARAGRAVFVTGATGTLGPRLVRELCARGAAVTCLVRARDDAAAFERLRATLPDAHGVRAVAGDVSLERFGMSQARWTAFAVEHDAIVHAAADLSLAMPYAVLRETNVLGTGHALDFAREGPPKAVHYISTLSVLASTDLARTGRAFTEASTLRDASVVHGAYAQTKWAAEALVRRVAPGAFVHRLGLLLPARSRDLFVAFVRGVAMLGCAPIVPALAFDVTPADFAASALAHFVTSGGDRRGRTRHIANRRTATLDDLVTTMRAEGARVEWVSVEAFQRRVAQGGSVGLARTERWKDLSRVSLRAAVSGPVLRAFDLFEATDVSFGAEPTLDELEIAGITCPLPADVLGEHVRIALASRDT